MLRSGPLSLLPILFLAACRGEEGSPLPQAPDQSPEASEVVLQAVDAGTGAALSDDEVTVRHLVRFPITLDEARVDRVSSSEPYRIQHAVAWDSLVVEVRVEASSYHRLDTVLTVARGASVGPVTLRMARRLGGDRRAAQAPGAAGGGRQTQTGGATPTRPSPSTPQPSEPDDGIDRTALRAGDAAFAAEDWATATNAYLSMPEPPRGTGRYAGEYARAKVRQARAHIARGEWGGALDALEEAVVYPDAGYQAFLYLGQAQCTVGRLDEGRATLGRIADMATSIPSSQRAQAQALASYQNALCTHQEFTRAEEPRDLLRTGAATIRELEAFIQVGQPLAASSSEVSAAVDDAWAKIESTRQRMRGG